MPDLGTRLQRELEGIELRPFTVDDFHGRRDRKRRNQRIAAGVVGIAVFVAAIWIVTSVGSLDRSETSVVPGGDVTGPAETGPAETGETGPSGICEGVNFCIPPAGTAVSTPVEGELIAEATFLRVYADGRVLSTVYENYYYTEQRLSPEGVERVRQIVGERVRLDPVGPDAERLVNLLLGISGSLWSRQSAWEDREGKPYVPARYAACPHSDFAPGDEAVLDLLPTSAQALLRGSDPALKQGACFDLAPVEARSLVAILSDAGSFKRDPWPLAVGAWSVSDGKGDRVTISLHPLFPDGQRFFRVPF
jgi:hypothetical protein